MKVRSMAGKQAIVKTSLVWEMIEAEVLQSVTFERFKNLIEVTDRLPQTTYVHIKFCPNF